jgi:RNA polymerase sigma-70 factor (ECF subfamily)
VDRQAERELLERVKAGQREACAELVREHHAVVYRFLVHLARDVHVAEDLTQETFAVAWQQIGKFRGRARIGTWLHRIAYNKFVDARRGTERSAALQARLEQQSSESQASTPMDGLLADERSRWLYDAVAQLDEAERTLIVLHYFQELSFREMAEVLGEPKGTVKWRTSQALGRLRSRLNDEPERENRANPTGERVRARVVGGRAAPPAEAAGADGA